MHAADRLCAVWKHRPRLRFGARLRCIRGGGLPFTSERVSVLHAQSRNWLAECFLEPFVSMAAVVTHHAPTAYSVLERYRGELLPAASPAAWTTWSRPGGPALWVYGHMHDPVAEMMVEHRSFQKILSSGPRNPATPASPGATGFYRFRRC